MDLLSKELDGFYRTSSGFCAVVPKLAAGVTLEGMKWFEFRTSAYSDIIKVMWPEQAPLAIFDNDTAVALIRAGYGFHPTDEVVAEYNKLVAEVPKAEPTPVAAVFPPEGWKEHPTAPGFYYKGKEVLSEAELRAK